jgi:malonyl CoA-acyl carrier protein transacylase
MVSLAAVWQAAGVTPDAVVGHSQGEIAAACVAGVLSLADGAKVVALRGQALAELAGTGGMMSVAEPVGAVQQRLGQWDGRVHIAAVNGPRQVVVSGDARALDELAAACERDGVRARRVEVDYASHSPRIEAVRGQVEDALAGVTAAPGTVAVVSGIDGQVVAGSVMDGGYWYRSLREPVQFHQAVQTLAASGHRVFIEVSPHPVLTPAIEDTLAETSTGTRGVVVAGTLRRDEGGLERLAASLAQVWVAGGSVDWSLWFPRPQTRVDLPTYEFQRQRYWPGRPAVTGNPAGLGQAAAGHPLLGAAVELPESGGVVLTGRLSLASQPWLADHQVAGAVLLPGSAFAELAVRAADEAGCRQVEELVLKAPLVIPDRGGVQVQLAVGAADESGRRPLNVYSRREDGGPDGPWAEHAVGTLVRGGTQPSFDLAQWPPPGAKAVAVDGLYEGLAGLSVEYGPAFRGLVAAWQRGEEVFAEVALPRGVAAESFGLHPALLDAALQAMALRSLAEAENGQGPVMPFAWSGLELHAAGATALRVRITATGPDSVCLQAADPAGSPVASVASLAVRPADLAALTGPGGLEWLFKVQWRPVELPTASAGRQIAVLGETGLDGLDEVPAVVVACLPADGAVPGGVREAVHQVLATIQAWMAEDRFASSRLVVATSGAVATGPDEQVTSLPGAAVWGLVASAQSEHPGQVVLADVDTVADSATLALIAAGVAAGEPRLAVRSGGLRVPRLARPTLADHSGRARPRDPNGTVLITGGTGALGALVARHLVTAHGQRHLILASRRGPGAPGMAELAADLAGLGLGALDTRGAQVQIVACDVVDREALHALLAGIPNERPLTGVVHAAGVLDDGLITSMSSQQADAALAVKAEGAWHLHELTENLGLDMFVLFSSAAGVLGNPGQGNYAAANSFLDALAWYRNARGLPAVSLAWGFWEQANGMSVGETNAQRMTRQGARGLSVAEALSLFDAGVASGEPALVAARLDAAVLGAWAEAVPPLLSELVRLPVRARSAAGAGDGPKLAERLASMPDAERERAVLEMIRGEVAAVLGHSGAEAVEAASTFLQLGFDSLTAVELRNRLNAATGLRLPAAAVFDHPTPEALAQKLCEQVSAPDKQASEDPRPGRHLYIASAGTAPTRSLGGLYQQAFRDGKVREIMELLKGLARLRPAFANETDLENMPKPVLISEGAAMPTLVCIASFAGRSGAHEYARFADGFRRIREVSALTIPGFAGGEPLPTTVEALATIQAINLRRSQNGFPFVLAGHSTGGLIAHAVAAHLESIGIPPAGVVLLDTYSPERMELLHDAQPSFMGEILAQNEILDAHEDDAWLTAMAHYLSLDWRHLDDISAPTLLVRAQELVVGSPGFDDLDVSWDSSSNMTIIDVPGNHFTMIGEHADITARAVNRWLDETF